MSLLQLKAYWVRRKRIKKALHDLGFDPRWLRYGFLDESYLLALVDEADGRQDLGDCYRYLTFRKSLREQVSISDSYIEKYIELTQRDEFSWVARDALINLAQTPRLSVGQIERLAEHPVLSDKFIQQTLRHTLVIIELQSEFLSPQTRQLILTDGDDHLQRTFLGSSHLTRSDLKVLAESGVSKAVRNIAKEKLRSHRYKE